MLSTAVSCLCNTWVPEWLVLELKKGLQTPQNVFQVWEIVPYSTTGVLRNLAAWTLWFIFCCPAVQHHSDSLNSMNWAPRDKHRFSLFCCIGGIGLCRQKETLVRSTRNWTKKQHIPAVWRTGRPLVCWLGCPICRTMPCLPGDTDLNPDFWWNLFWLPSKRWVWQSRKHKSCLGWDVSSVAA